MNRFAFAATAFSFWICGEGKGEDWYRYRGPRLDGISIETDWNSDWPAGGPEIAWTASVGTGFSSVVTSDGRLYTIGNEENVDTVYCLDRENGSEIWTHRYASPTDPNEFDGGPTSTPTVDGDRVYTLSRQGDLFCFDKASGQVHWSINVATLAAVRVPAWGFSGCPLVHGELLIVNVGESGVALNRHSGELVWASDDKDAGYSTPVPVPATDPPQVIIGSSRSYVCVDVSSGAEIWRQRWLTTFGCNAADPIIKDGRVFLSSGYNRGAALLKIKAAPAPVVVWKNKEMQNQISTSVLVDGLVYGVHGDVDHEPVLRCIDLGSGDVVWTDDSIHPGGLIAAGNRLIVLSDSGELVVGTSTPSGFAVTSRHGVLQGRCWTAPVLSGGLIYCRSADGKLVCVDVR
jgi:outer membrane protein assembly factor BamB